MPKICTSSTATFVPLVQLPLQVLRFTLFSPVPFPLWRILERELEYQVRSATDAMPPGNSRHGASRVRQLSDEPKKAILDKKYSN